MSYYVEYRRALRALRVVAIVLGLLLVAALLARLSWGKIRTQDDFVASMERSRTAHVTRTALPDGRTRTVIDDRKRGIHAVVERRGGSITSLVMDEVPSARGGAHNRERTRGVRASPQPLTETTVGTSVTYAFFGIGSLFSMTIPMGFFVATLLAGPLAKENNGHLELAWTKPVSRERYALSAVLVDVTALAVAQVATAAALLLATLFWEVPKLSFESLAPGHIAFALAAPIAWFACLTAFSASLKRGPGAVLGIGWVVAVACPLIATAAQNASTPVGRSVYAIFNAVSYLDPIAYTWFRMDYPADPARATVIGLLALAALAIAYLGAAVLQWRRVEA
ncbi:MAG TPA: ABC transporter permease subunit [Candidatus Elarobacter sp.]|nr:ABC transporter permease subunit [Candidatus Elarobacter sp.]